MSDDSLHVDWEGVVAREGPTIWRAVRRVVGNDADAEDVFQETFIAAVELARREPVRQVRGLLLRLAHARAIDRLRRRYRRARREEASEGEANFDAFASNSPLPEDEVAVAELSNRLREALAELPKRQAEVFCLFCLEGWTYQEISERLEISIDVVGVTIHRARAKLRTLLGADVKDAKAERLRPT